MLVQVSAKQGNAVPLVLLAAGAAALGVCWVGTFKQAHAGFGAVGGSFLVPIAIIYVYTHRNEWDSMQAHGTLLLLAFACFAAGHCFVRCLLWARWIAGAATVVFVFQLVAVGAKWHLGASNQKTLLLLQLGSLAGLGVALALAITKLYVQRPLVEHQAPHEPHL